MQQVRKARIIIAIDGGDQLFQLNYLEEENIMIDENMYNKQKCEHVNPRATCNHNQDHEWNQCGNGKEEQNTKINYKLQHNISVPLVTFPC